MLHHTRRTFIGRGLCVVGGALLLLSAASAALPASITTPADAQVAGLTVTATPTSDVLDGQAIALRVDAPAGQTISFGSRARICRDGPVYDSPDDLFPFTAGNCPNAGVSSSATPGGAATIDPLPDGSAAIGTLRVGTGRVEWGPATNPTQFSLSCDTENPCRLVLDVQTSGGRVIDASTLVTFADSEALTSCGGAEEGALSTSGSDRFIDSWARWTRHQCQTSGDRAPTNAVLAGEGLGLQAFHAGQSDLVYSATGPAIPSRPVAEPRASSAVPIGLNAVVIGVLGGYPSDARDWPSGIPRPFSDVRLTASETAALVGQGFFGFSPQPGDATYGRNPQFSEALTGLGGPALAPSSSDAITYLATRWFDERAAASWVTPAVPLDGIPGLTPRGIFDEFSSADPAFPVAIAELYSARASLKRVVGTASLVNAGSYPVRWVLTDLATAEQLDIPVAALENSRGEFVLPTAESLAAAVPSMETADDGTVTPAGDADAAGAYPLTFVEHAVAPTETLVDEECAPRPASQALLATWLDYLTGEGQAQLDGLQPLPASLTSVADAAKARVGVGGLPSRCDPDDPDPTPPTPPSAPAPVPPGSPSGLPPGAPPGGVGLGFPSTVAELGGLPGADGGSVGVEGEEPRADDADAAEDEAGSGETSGPKLPGLLGAVSLGGASGVPALLGLAFMGAGAGTLSSSSSLRPRRLA